MKSIFRQNYIWIIFLLVISAGSLGAELINGRLDMVDLEVYYTAADRLTDGGELYRTAEDDPYEHYVYKYAPPAALLFIPFLPMGLTISKFAYWLFLTLILGMLLLKLKTVYLGKSYTGSLANYSLILSTAVIGTHFFRELHLGQVNLLLLGMYVFALVMLRSGKSMGFGALIAISIFIKPFGFIFIPLIIIMGKYRELFYFLGFSLLMFFLPVLFYSDSSSYFSLFSSWFNELGIELGNKQELASAGNHSIFSILYRFTPVGMIDLNGTGRYIYQFIVLSLMAVLFLWFYIKSKASDKTIQLYIVLIAIIPLLAFTSYNAFIFTLPLVVYLMFKFKDLNIYFKILFILSCLLIGGNIYDLVGRERFDFFWGVSVFSWGTLGLLITLFAHPATSPN